MGIVFYYTPMSSATRVHWALEELGLPYDKLKLDLTVGDQRKPEFLKINPNGKVPTLVIDGQPLFESLAILIYLGETYGVDKGLFPPSGPQRLPALQWMAWGSVSFSEAVTRYMRNTSDRWPTEQRSAGAAEAARTEIYAMLKVLDAALEGRSFILGGFSIADCAIATMVAFAGRIGLDLSPYANVSAWVGRCVSRPAFAVALAG
jgi:glutathione S-transferase